MQSSISQATEFSVSTFLRYMTQVTHRRLATIVGKAVVKTMTYTSLWGASQKWKSPKVGIHQAMIHKGSLHHCACHTRKL